MFVLLIGNITLTGLLYLQSMPEPSQVVEKVAHAKPDSLKTLEYQQPSKPVILDDPTNDFVMRFEATVISEGKKYGVLPSVKMAQAILESDRGRSRMSKRLNNFFGIKCGYRKCPHGTCVPFASDDDDDRFRKYDSPWLSFRDHSKFLQQDRYRKLQKFDDDYVRWSYGLADAGYATDEMYGEKLIDIIEKYDLYKLDEL